MKYEISIALFAKFVKYRKLNYANTLKIYLKCKPGMDKTSSTDKC